MYVSFGFESAIEKQVDYANFDVYPTRFVRLVLL